jgi:hypothetical protein
MDFSALSNDELADLTRDLFDELHSRQAEMPDGPVKMGAGRRLGIAHRAMEVLAEHLKTGGVIQPYSGGEPKPDGP